MICHPCGDTDHDQCANIGHDTNTWCDCQHRPPLRRVDTVGPAAKEVDE